MCSRSLLCLPFGPFVVLLICASGRVSAGSCRHDEVTLLQVSSQAVPAQDDQDLRSPRKTPLEPSSVKPAEEFWPIGVFKASFITVASGSEDPVSAKHRQYVQMGAIAVLVVIALLVAYRAWPESNVVAALSLGSLYICASACMIETNKWLMLPGHFPFPLALTTNHMLTSWLLATGLRFICPSAFPALQKIEVTWWLCLKFVPIGAAFALSIVCGNSAYQFLSVSFLQVMKQCNIVVIYTFSVLFGLEALRRCSVLLLFGTLCGTMLAVQGEMHFKLVGFLLQVVSSLSEASKVILQSLLMSGTYKLDPLTMVLFMAPACLLANVIPFLVLEAPRMSEIVTQLHAVLPMIIFNAMLAFSLNVLVAQCIKQLSPVGYLLCGIVKDVCIIVTSSFFLGESLAAQQVVGFTLALTGVAMYSLYKQNQDCFEDDNLLRGFSRVAERLFGSDSHPVKQETQTKAASLPDSENASRDIKGPKARCIT